MNRVIKRFPSFTMGKCRCGCGTDIPIASYDYLVKYSKGHGRWAKYRKFVKKIQEKKKCECKPNCNKIINKYDSRKRERRYHKGHKPKIKFSHIDRRGYVRIWKPDHPNAYKTGWIMEHRYVMSQHLGRPLEKYEIVHHINRNTKDNRVENLMLFEDNSKHISETTGIDMSDRICYDCNTTKSFDGYYDHWYNHPLVKDKWLCVNCYQKIHKKLKKFLSS